jgi:hypothetical protein
MSKRSKQAATEYYMNLGTEDELSIPALASKHCVTHVMTVRRAINRLKPCSAAFHLAREFRQSAAVQAASNSTESTPAAAAEALYLNSGVTEEVYKQAMQHWAVLMKEKGKSCSQALKIITAKYGSSISAAALWKHVKRHGTNTPRSGGRAPKLDAEAEEQLLHIILLMWKALLPTWQSLMRQVCKQLIQGTKYKQLFKGGEMGDR